MDLSRYVGPAIRAFRLDAELSQEELAARADLDRTYISGVERGRRNPTIKTLQEIVEALGVDLDALLVRARVLSEEDFPRSRGAKKAAPKRQR